MTYTPFFVQAAEAAQLLGISRRRLYDLLKNDPTFPRPVRLTEGGFPRWRPKDLEAWAMGRQEQPKGPREVEAR